MGRERQKKKNRSGISKARRKPKAKRHVLNNPIIAANWDKSQTLEQNYQRLGLATKLNKHTGGREKKVSDIVENEGDEHAMAEKKKKEDGLAISSLQRRDKLDVAEAKVERDPETGKIIRVVESDLRTKSNPLRDPLNDVESEEYETFNQHASDTFRALSKGESRSEVVRRLEEEAARPAKRYKHPQSENERAFIAELVEKYGDDYAAMARDIKINYMQRSEGDLKRRVKKWRESGNG